MQIALLEITLRLPWARSLKDKRGEVKSLLAKVRNKFNVSAAEVDKQDDHQTAVLAFAMLVPNRALGDAMMESVLEFIEGSTEGEITGEVREYR